MTAHPHPKYNISAAVASVDCRDPFNIVVSLRQAGAPIHGQPLRVSFRFGEHIDPATLENAKSLSPGDRVDIEYTEITSQPVAINLGRSIRLT